VSNVDSFDAAILRCRERAAKFLEEQIYNVAEEQYWRHGPGHKPESSRSHLLYGTWAGALASVLLRGDIQMEAGRRRRIGNALRSFQLPDGSFVMPGIPEAARPTHSTEYFAFHCSNYALGALRALGEAPRYPLTFMEALRSRSDLEEWLSRRDWSRPWTEGNNIVNLASFYGVLAKDAADWARERLVDLAEWHDQHQNPATGFWHAGDATSRTALQNAMAGAAHNLHIYYLLEREVPRPTVIVESCLRLGYMGIRSACVDIDFVDILVNLRRYGHRVDEIDRILGKYLVELLQVQGLDGGFCDTYVTPSNCYGYVTPARLSLTWTTWFRLATIGMVVCALWPQDRDKWVFRDTVGMGYLNARYAFGGPTSMSNASGALNREGLRGAWLATVRRTRFFRQHVTWQVRQWMSGAAG
jgi:hypothetical protein